MSDTKTQYVCVSGVLIFDKVAKHHFTEAWEMKGKKKIDRPDIVQLLNQREEEQEALFGLPNVWKGGENGKKS